MNSRNANIQAIWGFLGFFMILVWAITMRGDFSGPLFAIYGRGSATGKVTDIKYMGVVHSTGSYATMKSYTFEFKDKDGTSHTGVSYFKGRDQYAVKESAPVEYVKGWPSISRIQGMSRGQIPMVGAMIPLVFTVILLIGLIVEYGRAMFSDRRIEISLASLILPLIVLGGHGLYAYFRFFR